MSRMIFINLPVKDLNRSVEFFTRLGYRFNPDFTDENATCMIVNDSAFVMLLVEPYFKTFLKKDMSDARKATEVLLCVSVENREQADEMVRLAVEGGAKAQAEPKDYGFMYQHGFEDLDGHQWEVMFYDPAAAAAHGG